MTLWLLASAGALGGGLAGAVVTVRLAAGDPTPAARASDRPGAVARPPAAAGAAMAGRSASRHPTPWPVADATTSRSGAQRSSRRRAAAERVATRRTATVAVEAPRRTAAPAQGEQPAASAQAGAPASAAGGTATAAPPVTPVPPPPPASAPVPRPRTQPPAAAKPRPAAGAGRERPTGAFDDSG